MELAEKIAPGAVNPRPKDVSSAFQLWRSLVERPLAAPLLMHQSLEIDTLPEEVPDTVYGALVLTLRKLTAEGLIIEAGLMPIGNNEATVQLKMPDAKYSRDNIRYAAQMLRSAVQPLGLVLNVEADSDLPWYGEQA